MNNKHVALVGHIRRLCSFGFAPRIVIPYVLEAFRDLSHAQWGTFTYAAKYHEHRRLMHQCVSIPENLQQFPGYVPNTGTMQRRPAAGSSEGASHLPRYKPDSYRIDLIVTDGKRELGTLRLIRAYGSEPFSVRTYEEVSDLIRHLVKALSSQVVEPAKFCDTGPSSIIVVDKSGDVVFQGAESRRLLTLAFDKVPFIDPGKRILHDLIGLPATGSSEIQPWHGTPRSAVERHNAAGRFLFKTYYQAGHASLDPASIAIYIEHHAPLALIVETVGFRLGLTERQRELCMHLVLDRTYADVAFEMGISEHTVIDHVRKIYEKLSVNCHGDLRRRFLASTTSATASSAGCPDSRAASAGTTRLP